MKIADHKRKIRDDQFKADVLRHLQRQLGLASAVNTFDTAAGMSYLSELCCSEVTEDSILKNEAGVFVASLAPEQYSKAADRLFAMYGTPQIDHGTFGVCYSWRRGIGRIVLNNTPKEEHLYTIRIVKDN